MTPPDRRGVDRSAQRRRRQPATSSSSRAPVPGRFAPRPTVDPGLADQLEPRHQRGASSPLKRMEEEERDLARRRKSVRVGVRLTAMGVVVLGLFAIMVFRLWSLQVLNSSSAQANVIANTTRAVPISAPRGLIEARGGQVLVSNEVIPVVTLSRQVAATDPAVVQRLAVLLGMPVSQVDAAINDQQDSIYQPVPVEVGVSSSTIVYLSEHRSLFPGVTVSDIAERQYPYGDLASQTLGYVADISPSELAALKNQGYTSGDVVGQSGIEAQYESYLRGKTGIRELLVDANGDPVGTKQTIPATPGDNVVLNLDLNLQEQAQTDLADEIKTIGNQAASGAVVVEDPKTGAVLAMASAPTYNPAWWVGGISTAHYEQITSASSNEPLINRAIQGQYTPGSTFKLATATAALDDGLITPYTLVSDPGYFTVPGCTGDCTFHNDAYESCGACDVETALTMSDDVFFYTMGYDFYSDSARYGTEPIEKEAEAYGFGEPSGIDLPGSYPGQVDGPALRVLQHKEDPSYYTTTYYGVGDAINTAFGQGETLITPLELANAYATFANGGTRYAPEVGAEIISPTGRLVKRIAPKVMGHVYLPAVTRQAIETGLEGVMTATGPEGGTATPTLQALNYPYARFPIAGKTGTSQVSTNTSVQNDSLFVAFGPVADPQYVIACVIPNAGYGASAAAPVVLELFEYLMNHPVGPVAPTVPAGAG